MPEYRKGYVYANDKPGLGVDIDEAEGVIYMDLPAGLVDMSEAEEE